MSDRVVQMIESALDVPGIAWWRRRRFEAGFRTGAYAGVCRGVYDTYAQAAAAAPAQRPLGYDHEGPAAMYRDRIDRVFPSDYPMLHWMGEAFANGATRVVDLGGHVGVSYYAYDRYLTYPRELSWQVIDVPAVAQAGRTLAATRDTRRALGFARDFGDAGPFDVLFTAGCVQYLEPTLAESLAAMPARPQWVFVNLLPLHEHRTYWTVQSIGEAFCPYRIERRSAFFDAMTALGYELCDTWVNPEKSCVVRFEPDYTIRGYVGAAFRLR